MYCFKQKSILEKIRDYFKLIAILKHSLFSPKIVSGHICNMNQTANKTNSYLFLQLLVQSHGVLKLETKQQTSSMNKNFHSWVTNGRSQEFVLKCLCWTKLSVMPLICVRTKPWTRLLDCIPVIPPARVLAFRVKFSPSFLQAVQRKLLGMHAFYLVQPRISPH